MSCVVCVDQLIYSQHSISTASPPLMSQLNQNSMARLVEVDVLEDGLGRELLELAVGVGLQVPG